MYDLTRLLPQKPPMLVISSILSYDPDKGTIVTEMNVSESCFYFDKFHGGVQALFGIEYLAQTAGCLVGIEDKNIWNKIDLILEVKSYSSSAGFFRSDKSYKAKVIKLEKISGLLKVEGFIVDNHHRNVASSRLKIFRK